MDGSWSARAVADNMTYEGFIRCGLCTNYFCLDGMVLPVGSDECITKRVEHATPLEARLQSARNLQGFGMASGEHCQSLPW
jgi:hypothetical protein